MCASDLSRREPTIYRFRLIITRRARLLAADKSESTLALVAIHLLLTRAIILYVLICAAWGLSNALRARPASDSYRTTLLIAEALFVVQALVGLELLGEGKAPAQWLHYLYGLLGIAVLPAVVGYVGRGKKRESLWLGLTALFLSGVAIRAMMTGSG